MATEARDLRGQIIDRRYRVLYELGRGGMGAVWCVQHVESLQHFALKTLESELASRPAARQRLLLEARAAGALRSRHVVRVVDAHMSYVHDDAPLPFLVMEHLSGLTLEQWMDTRGVLRPGELMWTMQQVARALALAHEHGVVHRDLKPSNLFLTLDDEGRPLVKLCDFGVAKLLDGASSELITSRPFRTSQREIVGTPLYLAPEVLRGGSQVTPATDQWALGLTVYKGMTGRDYFEAAESGPDLILKITHERMPPPSELEPRLGKGFDAWFFASCARDPASRFTDVLKQLAALDSALGRPAPIELVVPGVSAGRASQPDGRGYVAGAARSSSDGAASIGSGGGRWMPRLALVFGVGWALAGTGYLLLLAPETAARPTVPLATVANPPPATLPLAAASEGAPFSVVPSPTTPLDRVPNTKGTRPSRPKVAGRSAAQPTEPVTAPAAPESPAPAPAPAPAPPLASPKRGSGAPCSRSAECASALCVAERCQ